MTGLPQQNMRQSDPGAARDLDPDVRQRRASDPAASVWVGASAGTGKTKVLTDRVLRLLLPGADGRTGAPPHRILCLTFTKAAASEMALRVSKTLAAWAVMPDDALETSLRRLSGTDPTAQQKDAARRLFAAVADAPGGLNVMTIHSFCQSVLARFPLEAGLPPGFAVIDERQARDLLRRALDAVLDRARRGEGREEGGEDIRDAVRRLAAAQNEEQFERLLQSLCSERAQVLHTLSDRKPGDFHAALCAVTGADPNATEDSLTAGFCRGADEAALRGACRALAQGTEKTDRPRGILLQQWLDADPAGRAALFADYESLFLTADGAARKNLMTAALAARHPQENAAMAAEADRLLRALESLRALRCARASGDLLLLGRAILHEYGRIKQARAALDYDDLIAATRRLLDGPGAAPWVLFKLDGGLDHILVDEAQDTNPEQWGIIASLCGDFFAGRGAREETERTVFVVGDEKQSIYSFQRAAPREFERMRAFFAAKTRDAEKEWRDEALNISFRSAQSVLRLVDEVFADETVRRGLGRDAPRHHSFRRGQAGLAEIWPLFEPDETPQDPPWTPPVTVADSRSGAARLADHIGDTVRGWLESGEILESQGRPVAPEDIMILVRTRAGFAAQIVRALKTRGVPVSGVDRMTLGEQLAVMDLLAAARFALLPADDLSLACLLKSPFAGWDENRLYRACEGRGGSLWDAVKDAGGPEAGWLRGLCRLAEREGPYGFFSALLQTPCPADPGGGLRAVTGRMGEDALDPLDEFLNAALAFEKDNIPSLQNFLMWQQRGDITVKRELEEAGSCVRIMTVHGAKGLQAPVVILPDTTRTAAARKTPRLLWPDKSGLALPLWSALGRDDPLPYKKAFAAAGERLDEEYRRLLYVALTRAEDRIYIAGHRGRQDPVADSWYAYVERAFARLPDAQRLPGGGLRIANPQTRPADPPGPPPAAQHSPPPPPPPWLFRPAPEEPRPPRPLAPSRPSQEAPAARSPLQDGGLHRFRRGVVTHRLLQYLPALPPQQWKRAALDFATKPGHGLPPGAGEGIARETLAILENPAFAPLFGPGSLAEAPVAGLADGVPVSGQIDRLVVTDDAVLIVDYKTNRPPPQDESGVPDLYRGQMRAYAALIREIYPGRAVRCFLLWTDGPRLMEISI